MIEFAHFLQFISLSLGLLAIYIGFNTFKQAGIAPFKKYLLFFIGVNIVILVHVLEAFFKIIFSEQLYDENIRPFFTFSMYPLALLRLVMAALFVSFCVEISHHKKKTPYLFYAFGFFIVFMGLMTYLYLAPQDLSLYGEISFWAIHFILFASIAIGSIILLRHPPEVINPFMLKVFAYAMLFYAIAYLVLRTVNSWIVLVSEHFQIAGLGVIALIFNTFNVLALKRLFIPVTYSSDQDNDEALEKLYNEYGITNREQEIIVLICQGKTNKEIAEKLFISPVTVRDHISSIFRKTNVKNRTQAASMFQAYIV